MHPHVKPQHILFRIKQTDEEIGGVHEQGSLPIHHVERFFEAMRAYRLTDLGRASNSAVFL